MHGILLLIVFLNSKVSMVRDQYCFIFISVDKQKNEHNMLLYIELR